MAISLSPVQIAQLRKSWSVLAQDPGELASTMVVRLFRQHPEYQSIFKKLKGLTIDELPTNPQFIRHASKVGGALGSAIDHLDKPEELEELLTNLGIKHKKYGLKPEHFNNLGGVLVAMIGEAIGDTDPELLELWKSSLTAIMNVVMAGCF